MSFEPFVAAAIQMASGSDVRENLAAAAGLIEEAAMQDARLIVLPENFAIMGRTETDKLKVREADGDGPIQRFFSDTARRFGVWLVAGSVPMAGSAPRTCATAASSLTITANGSHVTTRCTFLALSRAASGIVSPIRSSRDPVHHSLSIPVWAHWPVNLLRRQVSGTVSGLWAGRHHSCSVGVYRHYRTGALGNPSARAGDRKPSVRHCARAGRRAPR